MNRLRKIAGVVLAGMLLGGAVWANAPEQSLRPDIRPGSDSGAVVVASIAP